jgi:hypothetical protein
MKEFPAVPADEAGQGMSVLSELAAHRGRLFLSENYICFAANILGVEQMHKIHFLHVVKIEKSKVFGVFNSGLTIHEKVKGERIARYQLGGFVDRNHAFNRIAALWKRHVPQLDISYLSPPHQRLATAGDNASSCPEASTSPSERAKLKPRLHQISSHLLSASEVEIERGHADFTIDRLMAKSGGLTEANMNISSLEAPIPEEGKPSEVAVSGTKSPESLSIGE